MSKKLNSKLKAVVGFAFSLFLITSCTSISSHSAGSSSQSDKPISSNSSKPDSSKDNLSSSSKEDNPSSSSTGNEEEDDKPFERGESGPVLTGKPYPLEDIPNAPEAYGPVPSNSQMKYYDEGLSMFIHFGINTFTDAEWGDGTEDPNDFQPTDLDTDQWVRIAKENGFKRILFTAKHHDGFVNYPTKYTDHSIASSTWMDGKGDVLRSLIDSCEKYDVGAGIYLSPWDRNMPCYSTDIDPDYNDVYVDMIKEIFENYGNENQDNIVEFWLDGACGEPETRPTYDYARWWETIYGYNNDVVIKSEYGSTVHWIGDKECNLGWGGDQNWQTYNKEYLWGGFPDKYNKTTEFNKYLNNGVPYIEGKTGKEDANIWSVSEADISIRTTESGETGAWFYSPTDKTRSVENLIDIYFNSVGRGGVFLLNVPPTTAGQFEQCDIDALEEFNEILTNTFTNDKALNAEAIASSTRDDSGNFDASNLTDTDYDTYWALPDDQTSGTVTINFEQPTYMDVVELQEYIPLGQRIHDYKVEVLVGDTWLDYGSGTTIGYKRLVKGKPVTADAIRVTVDGNATPILNHIGVYKTDKRVEEEVEFTSPGTIEASKYSEKSGDVKEQTKGGISNLGSIKNGNAVKYSDILFNATPDTISFNYAGAGNPTDADTTVTVRLDEKDGPVIATVDLASTGSYYNYVTSPSFEISYDKEITGYHDLWLSFQGGAGSGENAGINFASFSLETANTINFEQSEVFEDNSTGKVELKVKRTNASDQSKLRIQTLDLTGLSGVNYQKLDSEITFAENETEKTIEIPLLDSQLENSYFDFKVQIADAENAYIGTKDEVVVNVMEENEAQNYRIGTSVTMSLKDIKVTGEQATDDEITSTTLSITGADAKGGGKTGTIKNGTGDGFTANGKKQIAHIFIENKGDTDVNIRYYLNTSKVSNDLNGVTLTIPSKSIADAYFSFTLEENSDVYSAFLLCTNIPDTDLVFTGYLFN